MGLLDYFGARAKTNRNQWWLPAMELHRAEEGDGWDDEVPHFADSDSPTGGELERPPLSYDALTATGGPSIRRRVYDPSTATGETTPVVEAGSSARQMRPRVADPEQFTEDRINTLRRMPLEHVGFKRSVGMALENFGRTVTQGLQYAAASGRPMTPYDTMNIIGAGISSGAPMLAPRVASQAVRNEEIATNQRRLLDFEQARQKMAARADAALRQKQGVANYGKTLAEIDDIKDRPLREREKIGASAARAEQARVFRILTSLKGQRLDPDSPLVQKLRDDAERAGVPFDVDSFNNSKGNVVRYTRTDPEHPEQTVEVERNVVTGEESVLGQGRYQKPVGEDGMTASERQSVADRKKAFEASQRQRAISNERARAHLGIAQGRLELSGSQFGYKLSEDARREQAAANKILADAQANQEAADDIGSRTTYKDPDTGEVKDSRKAQNERDKYRAKAAALRRQFVDSYSYLVPGADESGVKMSSDDFRRLFGVNDAVTGEAQRLGITITDPNANQGPVQKPVIPRRSSPRSSASAAPRSQAQSGENPDVRAYADEHFNGDYGAALRKANADRAKKGLPPLQ